MSRKSGETWGTPIASFASRTGKSAPELAEVFDPSVIAESGVNGRISELGKSVGELVGQINGVYATKHGEDLFKPTNRTTQAFLRIQKAGDDLYFLFRESVGARLNGTWFDFDRRDPMKLLYPSRSFARDVRPPTPRSL